MSQDVPAQQSSTTRVLVANLPTVLNEWLAQIVEEQQDIEIIGQTSGYVELLLAAEMGVDVVVLSEQASQRPPGICSHLLSEYPDLKVLLLSPSGDKAVLYWLGLRQKELQIVSAEALLQTLRQLDTLAAVA